MNSAENRDLPDDDGSRRNDIRRAIRQMTTEFVGRCQTTRARLEVYWDLLELCVAALAAHGGVVWEPVAGMPSLFQCGVSKGRRVELPELGGEFCRKFIEPFLNFVANEREDVKVPPGEDGGCPGGMNPTDDLWLFAPIDDSFGKRMPFAVLQIVQRSGTPETTQAGYLRFMRHMCELAIDGLQRASSL